MWNLASFSVGQPKSAITLELLNWPPWIIASAKNSIPNWPHWSSLNYFPFVCPASFKEHRELGLQTCMVNWLHKFKKILLHRANLESLKWLLSVRNSLRKSPFCWLNLHLQTLKIVIFRRQRMAQYWLSFPLASPSKRLEKQCHFSSHQLNFTRCLWFVMQYFLSLISQNRTTSRIASTFD